MKPITKFEPLPTRILGLIYQHGHWIIDGKIDQDFGAGQIDTNTKAVWTTEGKRIEVSLGAAFIISQSREVETPLALPEEPPKKIEELKEQFIVETVQEDLPKNIRGRGMIPTSEHVV